MIEIKKNGQVCQYHDEFYSVARDGEHWIRLTDGCHRQCWNCYTPLQKKVYDLPQILENKVRFLDQNFLYAHPDPLALIQSLQKKLNGKVIRYTFLAGLDFTLFTLPILKAMKQARIGRFNEKGKFINGLSIAWDRGFNEVTDIQKAIEMMLSVGYSRRGIQIRVLCNGKISYYECMLKLSTLWDFKVMIDDCWFDNQKRGSVKPIYWTAEQCKKFGDCCRANNIAVMQRQHEGIERILQNKKSDVKDNE
ncbi:MAG: hypothetical protein ACFFDN_01340 [Candidatus Hodarchaeota archaeon]